MSAAKHTLGPWRCKAGASQMVGDGTTVAEIGPDSKSIQRWWIFSGADEHGDAEADARLIAAAPELHFQLLAAANYIDALGGDSRSYRAAIAKAEGKA